MGAAGHIAPGNVAGRNTGHTYVYQWTDIRGRGQCGLHAGCRRWQHQRNSWIQQPDQRHRAAALTLPASGSGSITVNLTDDANASGHGLPLGSGTYELFSFSSLANAFDPSEFTIGSSPLAAGSTYTFTEVGGNQIDLTISAVVVTGPQTLTWSGGTSAWDVATSSNWNSRERRKYRQVQPG